MKIKGNLVIGQSGGPTAVINNSLCGAIHEAQRHEEIEALIGMNHGIQGFLGEDLIDLRRESPRTIAGLRWTPSAALGSCRYRLQEADYARIITLCREYNIRYFLYAGGGDTMDTANNVARLAEGSGYEMRVIGIPKTIDNDLSHTDHAPGYGSAARFESIVCREIGRDTRAMKLTEAVKILETMGRNSGWLTAATALAGEYAPDLIYLPERAFYPDRFLADVEAVYRRQGFAVIAACEGLRTAAGEFVSLNQDPINVDAFGHPEPGGVGQYLADMVADELHLKTRVDKPGTMQRSSGLAISPVDAREAYRVGVFAVKRAAEGASGVMITLQRKHDEPYWCSVGEAPLELAANFEKKMDDAMINPEGNHVTTEFIRYALPLIGKGLPDYVSLEKHPFPKPRRFWQGS